MKTVNIVTGCFDTGLTYDQGLINSIGSRITEVLLIINIIGVLRKGSPIWLAKSGKASLSVTYPLKEDFR